MTSYLVMTVLSLIMSGVLTLTLHRVLKRSNDTISLLVAERDQLKLLVDKEKTTSKKLLDANEDLTREGMTDDRIREFLLQNPSFVKKEHTEAVLRAHGMAHRWWIQGNRAINVTLREQNGPVNRRYKLVTAVCEHCRIEHQYFNDGGHVLVNHMEGFFLAGVRIPVKGKETPRCLQLP